MDDAYLEQQITFICQGRDLKFDSRDESSYDLVKKAFTVGGLDINKIIPDLPIYEKIFGVNFRPLETTYLALAIKSKNPVLTKLLLELGATFDTHTFYTMKSVWTKINSDPYFIELYQKYYNVDFSVSLEEFALAIESERYNDIRNMFICALNFAPVIKIREMVDMADINIHFSDDYCFKIFLQNENTISKIMEFIDEFQIDIRCNDYIDILFRSMQGGFGSIQYSEETPILFEKLELLIEMGLEIQPKHYHYAHTLSEKVIDFMIKHGADKEMLLDSLLKTTVSKPGGIRSNFIEKIRIFSNADVDLNEGFKKAFAES